MKQTAISGCLVAFSLENLNKKYYVAQEIWLVSMKEPLNC